MRRILATLSVVGLLGVMVGCHHTAGYCDCDSSNPGCRTCGASPVPAGTVVKPEQLQEMPKENGKDKENKENKGDNKENKEENKGDKENKENKDGGPGF